jgi:hypothetical protein
MPLGDVGAARHMPLVGSPAHDQTTGIAMNDEDRAAITDLFQRLRDVEGRAGPRDPDAEALIHAAIARQPGAPYYMAQTIVVQNAALREAERRIADLEARAAEAEAGSGGLFGGLFGGGASRGRGSVPPVGRRGAAAMPDGGGGGGFLAGAAQTAMGVAGGVLLGNMIAGAMFGGDAAAAEESAPADEAGEAEMGGEDPGAGGDFGDFDLGDF